jgi:hypothetical protein
MMIDLVEVLRCFLGCNNMCSSDVVRKSRMYLKDVSSGESCVLIMMTMMILDALQEQDVVYDCNDDVRCVARAGCGF